MHGRAPGYGAAMVSPSTLSARELKARLDAGEPLQLVDVREPMELELAKLAEPVIHLPLGSSPSWIEQLPALLDPQLPVVVLCHAGIRSWQFGCWLMEAQGYGQVWNLQGGIDAWSVDVDPSVPRY